MRRMRGVYILEPQAYDLIYGLEERREIGALVELLAPPFPADQIDRHREALRDAEVLLSGWGAPLLDQGFLNLMPNLRAVFYGAGAVGYCITRTVWDRGILISSAYAANAQPVAEYTLAMILFSLKHGWALSRETRASRGFPARDDVPGCYGSVVGLVSLGMCARTLVRLLEPFDLQILAYDPYITSAEAHELGVRLCSIESVFGKSDVVSVHTPDLDETVGLITGQLLRSMKRGASFINTARGQVVREEEMIQVLRERPDLQAILDVTHPEPPAVHSPLYTLPNVVLTPHIAGSVGRECRRMGRYMVEELQRYAGGEPLRWLVTPDLAAHSSHRPQVTVMIKRPRKRSRSGRAGAKSAS